MTRRVLRSSAPAVVLVTIALVVVVVFRPVTAELAVDAYVLVVGGILLLSLVQAATAASPGPRRASAFEQALRAPEESVERPAEVARVEREVFLGVASAFYLHYRLRPLLRELAEQRLGERYSADLDDPRPEIRALLPDEAWPLVHSERPPPRDRHAPGIPLARLSAIVDALERI
jgi:hypothetical protein